MALIEDVADNIEDEARFPFNIGFKKLPEEGCLAAALVDGERWDGSAEVGVVEVGVAAALAPAAGPRFGVERAEGNIGDVVGKAAPGSLVTAAPVEEELTRPLLLLLLDLVVLGILIAVIACHHPREGRRRTGILLRRSLPL